jgi:hypothetical protein
VNSNKIKEADTSRVVWVELSTSQREWLHTLGLSDRRIRHYRINRPMTGEARRCMIQEALRNKVRGTIRTSKGKVGQYASRRYGSGDEQAPVRT